MYIPKVVKSNLLILKGVYPENFTGRIPRAQVGVRAQVYTDIPPRFTSVDEWKRRVSNLKCWSCDLLFNTYPAFIPENIEDGPDGLPQCEPRGNFCVWNCAISHVLKEYPDCVKGDACDAIALFESLFSGKRKQKIMPSPPKTLMQAYCGNNGITPAQYKEMIAQLNSDYDINYFKLEDFKS